MPKEKELTGCIPRIYKCNAENIMLFSWVNAQRQVIPTVSIEQAIWNYFKFIGADSWDMEAARTQFHRLQKFYFNDCKT
jgi:hypothetical protein